MFRIQEAKTLDTNRLAVLVALCAIVAGVAGAPGKTHAKPISRTLPTRQVTTKQTEQRPKGQTSSINQKGTSQKDDNSEAKKIKSAKETVAAVVKDFLNPKVAGNVASFIAKIKEAARPYQDKDRELKEVMELANKLERATNVPALLAVLTTALQNPNLGSLASQIMGIVSGSGMQALSALNQRFGK